ncbi:hypothetical protein CcCBS67573_g07165 [Chytriomyces confervae]|uniref:Uncharacterized protein n=1 Tax=Chytriomyces confervae TaxID=246404 RepID=A0A507EYL0_9FUNG|nr:hypothetical protein CcCBS67573_g07165 [Chytriomyces confervae]
MGCFTPLTVKAKAFMQKMKGALNKKKSAAARSAPPATVAPPASTADTAVAPPAIPEKDAANASSTPAEVPLIIVSEHVHSEAPKAVAAEVSSEPETSLYEADLSKMTSESVAFEVVEAQRLMAAKYGVAIVPTQPISAMYTAKAVNSETTEFPETVGQMYPVQSFYATPTKTAEPVVAKEAAKTTQPTVSKDIKVEKTASKKSSDKKKDFLPLCSADLTALEGEVVAFAEVQAALAFRDYSRVLNTQNPFQLASI